MRNMFRNWIMVIPLIVITLFLSSCGKVAKETGSDGGSSGGGTNPPPNPPATTYTIQVNVTPNTSYGSVTVSPNNGTQTAGTLVSLTAASNSGFMFSQWSGAISGSLNVTSVLMDGDKIIYAEFVNAPPAQYPLNISVVGNGSIVKNPSQSLYNAGDNVIVSANPDPGWTFDQWSGDFGGNDNPKLVNINTTYNATATFKQLFTLTTIVSPSAAGAITPANGSTHKDGTTITVEAANNSGYTFDHWEGDVTGTGAYKSLLMNSNKTVTAVFNQVLTYALNTSVSPVGAGSITKTPNQSDYTANTSVQVQANANTGYVFDHWSGDLTGSVNPTNITMDATKNITAVYKYWQNVGNVGWSDGQVSYCNLFFIGASPYIAYADTALGAPFLGKYNGSAWASGGGYVSGAPGDEVYSVYDSSNNIVYVAFRDSAVSNKITVRKYQSGSWSTVGTAGFSAAAVIKVSIALDSTGGVYVAYTSSGETLYVKKYNTGTTAWDFIGSSSGIASVDTTYSPISLAIDGTTPYIAYPESTLGKACVMKYSAGSWSNLGSSSGFSVDEAKGISMAVYSGNIYVSYSDQLPGPYGIVAYWNGSSWIALGGYNLSSGGTTRTSMFVDSGGIPYVAFDDSGLPLGIKVYKYSGGNWSQIGSAFGGDGSYVERYLSLYVYNGIPYVAFRDTGNGNKCTVKKFDVP